MQADQLLNHRYRLTEVVGVGRRSVVWRARDENLDRTVAIRTFVDAQGADGRLRERMVAQVRAAAAVIHPNVAHTYGHGEDTDDQGHREPFVLAEFVSGPTLAERNEILSPLSALTICADVANALAAAHDKGVVHGNVKPSNVMLSPTGVKVVDFAMTLLPEGADATPASDVCAVGLLTYWLLARELAWPPEMSAPALLAHLGSQQERLPALPQLPDEVADICLRCLDRDPDQRPSASEVAAVLGSVLERAPLAWSEAASWLADESAVPVRTVRLSRMAPLAAAMALLVAGVLWFMASVNNGPENAAGALIAPIDLRTSTTRPSALSTTTMTPGTASESATPSPTPSPSPTSASPSPTPSATVAPPPPPPLGASVSGIGGTIFVVCRQREATVTSVQPSRGFAVVNQSLGPGRDIEVVFASLVHRTDIRARCGQGGLEPTVRES